MAKGSRMFWIPLPPCEGRIRLDLVWQALTAFDWAPFYLGGEPGKGDVCPTPACFSLHVCMYVLSQSCPALRDPMDCSPPGPSVCGIFPGKNTGVGCRILLQGIFLTGIEPTSPASSALAGRFFTTEHPGSPLCTCIPLHLFSFFFFSVLNLASSTPQ